MTNEEKSHKDAGTKRLPPNALADNQCKRSAAQTTDPVLGNLVIKTFLLAFTPT